ncbi:luciferin 4-monooxygenase-like [Hyposmocoma kahamanoa]|uniref:luciferin 4-monooxygenase-like n=1 Tax=Hyposmocoma kahamanoa TaxID=1477025 RepID=UPI000E6D928D|nr:luciferin 4-monooxygenase-like [Hyposmocoma kahamanoa]
MVIIADHVALLKKQAAERHNISTERCHIGHVILEGMLQYPDTIHQIDAVTQKQETNISVANRTKRLATAMRNYGLKVNDNIIVMGNNHLDLCIPYFACHFNGYALCAVDPIMTAEDLQTLFHYVSPEMVFCSKDKVEDTKNALSKNNLETPIVVFDDKENDLEAFVKKHNGTEEQFCLPDFDHSKTIAWLMLTSGTTGLPKVAVIPFDTLLSGLCCWWVQFTDDMDYALAMATIQWMSSLIIFSSTCLMNFTRVQLSVPITPQLLIHVINKYKPKACAWTPYLLGQFLRAAGDLCDLSSFKYIAIGGSSIEKPLFDQFSAKCGAYLYLVYGMTELLVPVFEYNRTTPFGSTGKPMDKFQYRLVAEDGSTVTKPNEDGELWLKGDAFFKGYFNNPEETRKIINDDGWIMTGDIFYKTEDNYYHFVERKRLLIKYCGFWISPLQLEDVIKQHPAVAEVCVVGIPDKETTETPVAIIQKKNGCQVEASEIFKLVREKMPDVKQLHGGLYFLDSLPQTPSGKVHRAKLKEMTITATRIMPTQ